MRDQGKSMRGSLVAFVGACMVGLGVALAQGVTPPPSPGDPRIRIVGYQENQIIALRGHLGYQMLVEFDPAERIENVAIGDSLGWQVTPNRAATLLFLKPITRGAATNMTVVTTLRRYSFELTAREATGPSDPNIIYTVRFAYPAPPAPAPAVVAPAPTGPTLADLNLAYSVKGGGLRAPKVHVFDDGKATYFQFAETADAPAIFIIGADGEEELVNSQWRGAYMVIDQVAPEFVLRIGRQQVRVKNEAWREPTPGPLTPPDGAGRR
jgi:type IV secretion system protein VirB9